MWLFVFENQKVCSCSGCFCLACLLSRLRVVAGGRRKPLHSVIIESFSMDLWSDSFLQQKELLQTACLCDCWAEFPYSISEMHLVILLLWTCNEKGSSSISSNGVLYQSAILSPYIFYSPLFLG